MEKGIKSVNKINNALRRNIKRVMAVMLSVLMMVSVINYNGFITVRAQTQSDTGTVLANAGESMSLVTASEEQTTLDISKGGITIGDGTVSGYDGSGIAVTVADLDGYRIVQSDNSPTGNSINITGGTHNITLAGINITSSIIINGNSNVRLTLEKDTNNVINSASNFTPAIPVKEAATLTICGEGSLNIFARYGIGGANSNAGSINIEGGIININSLMLGIGVYQGYNNYDFNQISISGGIVNVTSSYRVAIGLCNDYGSAAAGTKQGKISISGGCVTASGAYDAGNPNNTYSDIGVRQSSNNATYGIISLSEMSIIGGSVKAVHASNGLVAGKCDGSDALYQVKLDGVAKGTNILVDGALYDSSYVHEDGLYMMLEGSTHTIQIGDSDPVVYIYNENSHVIEAKSFSTEQLDISKSGINIINGIAYGKNSSGEDIIVKAYENSRAVITGTSSENSISVQGTNTYITLNNCSITNGSLSVAQGTLANVLLEGSNSITSSVTSNSGNAISVPEGAAFVIDKNSTGNITVLGYAFSPAIGYYGNCGTIRIEGGQVIALNPIGSSDATTGTVELTGGVINCGGGAASEGYGIVADSVTISGDTTVYMFTQGGINANTITKSGGIINTPITHVGDSYTYKTEIYGDRTLQENMVINHIPSLSAKGIMVVGNNSSLTIPEGNSLTNKGILIVAGNLNVNGTFAQESTGELYVSGNMNGTGSGADVAAISNGSVYFGLNTSFKGGTVSFENGCVVSKDEGQGEITRFAQEGDTISFTLTPQAGSAIEQLPTVISGNDNITVTKTSSENLGIVGQALTFAFTMPKHTVTISANLRVTNTIQLVSGKTEFQNAYTGQSASLLLENGQVIQWNGTGEATVEAFYLDKSGNKTGTYSDTTSGAYTQGGAPVNAGTYYVKVVISADDEYVQTISDYFTVTIEKAAGSGSVTMEGWTYGETAKNPIASSITNGTDNVTFKYKIKGADDSTYTDTKPSNAGTYTVKAIFGATSNYVVVEATTDFTIEKAEQSGFAIEEVTGKKYGDSAFTLSTTGGNGTGQVTYSVPTDNGILSVNGDTATIIGAGKVILTATKAEENNYNSTTATYEINIGKATAPTIIFPTAGGITYGQKLSECPLNGGSTQYGTFAWEEGDVVPVVFSGTNNANVIFTPNADTIKNYETITYTRQSTSFAVTKATPTVTVNTVVYGNSGNRTAGLTVTINLVGSGHWPSGTLRFIDCTNGSEIDIPNATAVTMTGSQTSYTWTGLADQIYKVKVVYSGDAEYNAATSDEFEVDTIKKNQSPLTIGNIGTKTYGDSAFAISTTGGDGEGWVSFTSSDPTIVSFPEPMMNAQPNAGIATTASSGGNIATIHKAGTVTITATKYGDNTYNETSTSVSLTIGKKALVVKADDKQNIIVGSGMPQLTYKVTGLVGSDTFIGPTIVTTAADTNTTGEYEIRISGGTLTNASNYLLTYTNGKLTVVKAGISNVTISGISNMNYTGKAITQPNMVVKVGGKVLKNGTDYTLSYMNNTNIGTATVTITGKGSYTGTVKKSFNITVGKGTTFTINNLKYKVTNAATNGKGTVTLTGSSKSKSKLAGTLKIGDSVKIGGKSFQITAINAKAFKGYMKLTKVIIGKNVTTIGKEAFSGCKKLKVIVIGSKKLKKVDKLAVKGIYGKAVIKVPVSKVSTYKKLFNNNTGFTKKMNIKK